MFKVNMFKEICSSVSIVNFEQVNAVCDMTLQFFHQVVIFSILSKE